MPQAKNVDMVRLMLKEHKKAIPMDAPLHLFYPEAALQELHPCITTGDNGGWQHIKGVMDSGATDSVTHPSTCAEYEVQESAGSRVGQKYTSASGDAIANLGEKVLDVMSENGVESRIKYQAADVSRTLNSVSEICDAGDAVQGQYVLFNKWGGVVLNLVTGRQIPFAREDGIYTMEMWVKPQAGFTMQG